MLFSNMLGSQLKYKQASGFSLNCGNDANDEPSAPAFWLFCSFQIRLAGLLLYNEKKNRRKRKKKRNTEWSSPVWGEIIDECLTAHNGIHMFCLLPGWRGQDGNYSIFEITAYREVTHLDLQNLDGDLVIDTDKYLSVYGFSWVMSLPDGGSVSLEMFTAYFSF